MQRDDPDDDHIIDVGGNSSNYISYQDNIPNMSIEDTFEKPSALNSETNTSPKSSDN